MRTTDPAWPDYERLLYALARTHGGVYHEAFGHALRDAATVLDQHAALRTVLTPFLQQILDEYGANDHQWLVVQATRLLEQIVTP